MFGEILEVEDGKTLGPLSGRQEAVTVLRLENFAGGGRSGGGTSVEVEEARGEGASKGREGGGEMAGREEGVRARKEGGEGTGDGGGH